MILGWSFARVDDADCAACVADADYSVPAHVVQAIQTSLRRAALTPPPPLARSDSGGK